MCQRAVCRSCRKMTYEGCGRHVDQVLMGVPTAQRCICESAERRGARAVEAATRSESVPARQGESLRHAEVLGARRVHQAGRGVAGGPGSSIGRKARHEKISRLCALRALWVEGVGYCTMKNPDFELQGGKRCRARSLQRHRVLRRTSSALVAKLHGTCTTACISS